MSDPQQGPEFLLGKIEATVSGTAEDVRMLRTEVGTMNSRLVETEKAIAEIQSERRVMIPEYDRFVHKVRNHMAVHEAWRSTSDGERKGWIASGRMIHALVTIGVVGIGGILVKLFA